MVNNKKKGTNKKVREERKKKLEIQYCTKEQRQERVKETILIMLALAMGNQVSGQFLNQFSTFIPLEVLVD